MNSNETIIFFDGVCSLCNSVVDFVHRRDSKNHFKYASLQGNTAQKMIPELLEDEQLDSLIYYKQGKTFTESSAALHIAKGMSGVWPVLFALILVPKGLRDVIYRWVARNRYRWFGKRETCRMPEAHERPYFLD
jgi:predicted DCC family thiol-disulfide oxidoreductase YuxK